MGDLLMVGGIIVFTIGLLGWVLYDEYNRAGITVCETEGSKRGSEKIVKVINSITTYEQGRMAGKMIIQYKRRYGGGLELEKKLQSRLLSIRLSNSRKNEKLR